MDIWTVKEVVVDNCYQIESDKKLDTVIDVGSGVGDFSIMVSSNANKVISYDVNDSAIECFKKNLKINKVAKVVICNKKVTSLDEVFKENKLNKCDLLKVDCEGCEYQIFESTSESTLKKILNIVMEYHLFDKKMEGAFIKMKKRFEKKNWKISIVKNPVHERLGLMFLSRS